MGASPAPGPVELLRADTLPGLAPALPNEDAALVHAQHGRARTALRTELETIYAQQDPDLVALRASFRPRAQGERVGALSRSETDKGRGRA